MHRSSGTTLGRVGQGQMWGAPEGESDLMALCGE